MSRNLCNGASCEHCPATVEMVEVPRPITREEAHVYFDEYEGMLVANAECPACRAQYLAWVEGVPHYHKGHGTSTYPEPRLDDEGKPLRVVRDLSYRSTFNDEPGLDDLPLFEVEQRFVRVGPSLEPKPGSYSDYLREQYPEKWEKRRLRVKACWHLEKLEGE